MTQALGNFYRNSLNSGMDFVLVKEEIECIQSYITILNIHYDNNIIVSYDIEKEIENFFIPKLLLQPFIENAVYHGIKKNDGKGLDIWDVFCSEKGNVFEGHTGDVACDHYHRFKEDVTLMKQIGVKAYRFLINWSRIFQMSRKI